MAKDQNSRLHPPTPNKLRRLRRQGDIPKSIEFVRHGLLLLLVLWGLLAIPQFSQQWLELTRNSLRQTLPVIAESTLSSLPLRPWTRIIGVPLFSLFALLSTGAIVLHSVQLAVVWAPTRCVPSWRNLSPANALRNLFSASNLVECCRSWIKSLFLLLMACAAFRVSVTDILCCPRSEPDSWLLLAIRLPALLTGSTLLLLVPFTLLDLLYQKLRFRRKHGMSRKELLDEMKEEAGDPMLLGRRRELHKEVVNAHPLRAVADATVVIVNPTRYAAAIEWHADWPGAPVVVARGTGAVAGQIRKVARENHVPLFRDILLARKLVRIDTGSEIPEHCYQAVINVLIKLEHGAVLSLDTNSAGK